MFTALAAFVIACASPVIASEVNIGDVTLEYDDRGEGLAVVFVHGAISDRRAWEPLEAKISSEYRYLAYDQRYFGPGTWPDDKSKFSADTHAADLIAVIERLGVGPVAAVSWSYGGDVVSRAVISRPDLFKALVLYEPDVNGLIEGIPGASEAVDALYAGFGPAMVALEEGRLEDASLRFIDLVFDLPEGGANEEPEKWRQIWRENGRTIPMYLEAPAGDLATCDELQHIGTPALVIGGENSVTYDNLMATRMAECLPNALALTMDGVNHDGPYRKPEYFAEKIIEFIRLID